MLVYKIITLVSFISFFLLYLQGNFLSGKLPTLTGEKIIWANYGKTENVILITALIILVVVAMFLVRKVKLDRTLFHASVGASLVSLMLIIALVSAMIKNDTFIKKENPFAATTKNLDTISSNKNFLIFLADTADSKVFYDVMNQDEDFRGMFEDFTYYPDTLGFYPLTARSIPAILTGAVHRHETAFLDYSRKAYNNSPLFKNLTQRGYEINLYSSGDILWQGYRNFKIENATSIRDIKVNFNNFKKQVWRYVRFKYLPYGYKQYSHIEAMDFDACKVENKGKMEYYHWNNKINYDRIQQNPTLTKKDGNFFSFIHAEGSHVPLDMDKYLNRIQNGTYEQKVAASLTLIKAYLQRLKANNAYDNSVIIIMADHGYRIAGNDYKELNTRANPVLFVKGFKEKHEMKISDIPVSYYDLQQAFADLLEDRKSTELFANIEYGRTRTFLSYKYGGSDLRNEIVEFSTTSKAWEIDKLIPTGNVYTLKK